MNWALPAALPASLCLAKARKHHDCGCALLAIHVCKCSLSAALMPGGAVDLHARDPRALCQNLLLCSSCYVKHAWLVKLEVL